MQDEQLTVPDFVVLNAVRYAMMRKSYASSEMANEVVRLAPQMGKRLCDWLLFDIGNIFKWRSTMAAEDYETWEKAYKAVGKRAHEIWAAKAE